jgi:hypothetical protein
LRWGFHAPGICPASPVWRIGDIAEEWREDPNISMKSLPENSFLERLQSLDISLLGVVPTSATEADRSALLALHLAVRKPNYSYLEIGSELGGSLQAHLEDSWCFRIFSIDLRVETAGDFRGTFKWYPRNTTAAMYARLEKGFALDELRKLETFDMKASEVRGESLHPPPSLVFIDAEHTDHAVLADFLWALTVVEPDGWIAFHDGHLVCDGIQRALVELTERGVEYAAGQFPGSSVFTIVLGNDARIRLGGLAVVLNSPDAFFRWARFRRWNARLLHRLSLTASFIPRCWRGTKRWLRKTKQ